MLNVKVTIQETSYTPHTTKTGRAIGFQKALIAPGNGAVLPMELVIDPTKPYPVGEYTLSPDSFAPGAFGRIEFRPRLVALSAVKPVAVPKVG